MKQLLPVLCILFFAHAGWSQTIIKSTDPRIRYAGRLIFSPDSAQFIWSGSSATISFNGTGIKATLKDEGGENYFKVIVDGTVLPDLHLDTMKHSYTLADHLPKGKHMLQLFKRTEWTMGNAWLYGFELERGSTLAAAPPAKKRKIEFYGNSITCGYAVLDTMGKDRGTAPFEDNYLSYAAITARHFDAEYSCIARSGIGVLVSWFPQTMPEMYDLLDPADSSSKWDFSQYTPDVVVINLFQNDSWIVLKPDNPEFKHRFDTMAPSAERIVAAYQELVQNIRNKYPRARIICALGNMDATKEGSPWPHYIEQAVANLHDVNMTTHFFPYKNTPGHPSRGEQQAMADDLIQYIEKNVKW